MKPDTDGVYFYAVTLHTFLSRLYDHNFIYSSVLVHFSYYNSILIVYRIVRCPLPCIDRRFLLHPLSQNDAVNMLCSCLNIEHKCIALCHCMYSKLILGPSYPCSLPSLFCPRNCEALRNEGVVQAAGSIFSQETSVRSHEQASRCLEVIATHCPRSVALACVSSTSLLCLFAVCLCHGCIVVDYQVPIAVVCLAVSALSRMIHFSWMT